MPGNGIGFDLGPSHLPLQKPVTIIVTYDHAIQALPKHNQHEDKDSPKSKYNTHYRTNKGVRVEL